MMETEKLFKINSENINFIDDRTLALFHSVLHKLFKQTEEVEAKADIISLHILISEELNNRGLDYEEVIDSLDRLSDTLCIKVDNSSSIYELTEASSLEELSKKQIHFQGFTSEDADSEDHTHTFTIKYKEKEIKVVLGKRLDASKKKGEALHAHRIKLTLDGQEVVTYAGITPCAEGKKHHHAYSFGAPVKKKDIHSMSSEELSDGESKVKNHNYFSSITSGNVYYFAFISADGHVNSEDNSIEFSLKTEDREMVEKFKKAIGSTNEIDVRDGMARFKFKSKDMVEDLTKFGAAGDKQNRTAYKHAGANKKLFVRAVFDGEGTLSAEGTKQLQFGSTNEQLAKFVFTEMQKVSGADREIVKEKLASGKTFYKVAYNGEPAVKVAKWIYSGGGLYLARKKKIADAM